MNYSDALKYLGGFSRSGAPVTDLSRFSNLIKLLGNPHSESEYIHVAGTNGKGSVCEYCAAGLELAGYKTGKFTSPFITRIEERIQVNGEPISEKDFAFYISQVREAAEEAQCSQYSQFEILTAAAFLYFRESKCRYTVLETGIGGLLDCTNIVDPMVSVITAVDLDHCSILGNTAAQIALHKAGIIKKNRPVVVSPFQYEDVIRIISQRARESGSRLILPDNEEIKVLECGLSGTEFLYGGKPFRTHMCGRHQAANGVTAIEALRSIGVGEEHIEKALLKAAVPARMEEVGGWIIDGAHNPSGARAAAELFKGTKRPRLLLTGMLGSKDWKGSLSALIPLFDRVVAVDFFSEGAVPKENIAEFARSSGIPCITADNIHKAFKAAEGDGINFRAVCGSLYLCGEIRRALMSETKP